MYISDWKCQFSIDDTAISVPGCKIFIVLFLHLEFLFLKCLNKIDLSAHFGFLNPIHNSWCSMCRGKKLCEWLGQFHKLGTQFDETNAGEYFICCYKNIEVIRPYFVGDEKYMLKPTTNKNKQKIFLSGILHIVPYILCLVCTVNIWRQAFPSVCLPALLQLSPFFSFFSIVSSTVCISSGFLRLLSFFPPNHLLPD